jgi:hypothetical protein
MNKLFIKCKTFDYIKITHCIFKEIGDFKKTLSSKNNDSFNFRPNLRKKELRFSILDPIKSHIILLAAKDIQKLV